MHDSRRKLIAVSNHGRKIYSTRVYDPNEEIREIWNIVGSDIRSSMDTVRQEIYR
jgi:hypothetical protein